MPDDSSSRESDRDLFRQALGEVRRLRHDRVEALPRRPPPRARQREIDERRVLADSLSAQIDPAELDTGEHVAFARPGVQRGVLRKLQRGQYCTQAGLDLHGMDRHAARASLAEFLRQARDDGLRCVRVVHGKGLRSSNRGPVLKPLIQHWLRQRDEVLAYCSALPVDGGSGALYVLLRAG